MLPLTPDDLLPLAEYVARRREFFDSHRRYLDRYRRVRLGPRATLLFENRQTLWFRVQEILRVARLADPERIQDELDLHNQLLPGPDCLQAALLIDLSDVGDVAAELTLWQSFEGRCVQLHAGDTVTPAVLVTCRPEDYCIGAAHWLSFPIDAAARRCLENGRLPAYFEITFEAYGHRSAPLHDDVRQSLVDDLKSGPVSASR